MKISSITLRTFLITLLFGASLISGAVLFDSLQRKPNGFGFFQIGAVCAGSCLILFAWAAYSKPVFSLLGIALKFISTSFLLLGIVLLTINITGMFISLRKPVVNQGVDFFGKLSKPRYSPQAVAQMQDKRPNETVEEYAHRLTHLVNQATIQLPDDRGKYPQFELGVPIHENYILWLFRYISPGNYDYYQFCDPAKALERAVTTCGQATRIVQYIWFENGMNARRVTLDGHIIIEVQVDKPKKIWWTLDPLYDVVLEYDVKTLSKNSELVVGEYETKGYSEIEAMKMADMFTPPGNYVITEKNYCTVERQFYMYKWIFPLMLLMPFLAMKALFRHNVVV